MSLLPFRRAQPPLASGNFYRLETIIQSPRASREDLTKGKNRERRAFRRRRGRVDGPTFRISKATCRAPNSGNQQTASPGLDIDSDGNLDALGKPYKWDAPGLDIWLDNGSRKFGGGQ